MVNVERFFGHPESVLEKLNGFSNLRGTPTAFSFCITQSSVCNKVFVFEESVTTRGGKYGVIFFQNNTPILQSKRAMTIRALPHYLERITQTSFGAIGKSEKEFEN